MTKKKFLENIVKGAAFVERMECIDLIDKAMSKEHLDQLYEEGTSRDALLTAQCMLETLREQILDRNDPQEPSDD